MELYTFDDNRFQSLYEAVEYGKKVLSKHWEEVRFSKRTPPPRPIYFSVVMDTEFSFQIYWGNSLSTCRVTDLSKSKGYRPKMMLKICELNSSDYGESWYCWLPALQMNAYQV